MYIREICQENDREKLCPLIIEVKTWCAMVNRILVRSLFSLSKFVWAFCTNSIIIGLCFQTSIDSCMADRTGLSKMELYEPRSAILNAPDCLNSWENKPLDPISIPYVPVPRDEKCSITLIIPRCSFICTLKFNESITSLIHYLYRMWNKTWI